MPYNHAMRHLDILIPFGLAPAEMANDLLRQLQAPHLALLLGRSSRKTHYHYDPYARSLPHEQWLARQYGMEPTAETSPPLAAAVMQSFGLTPTEGCWFMLQPAHLHVARDHLVLTDLRGLSLDEKESRALFDAAHPLLQETGLLLLYGDRHHWFLRADDWADLRTATPDAASGHNIEIWLPKGTHERAWRRLHNEVQMTWHMHAVNAERENRGANPVNALWMWGGGSARQRSGPASAPASFSLPHASHAFSRAYQQALPPEGMDKLLASTPERAIIILDNLIPAALAQDWGEWINRYQHLETDYFSPLLAALKAGTINSISLVMTDSVVSAEFTVSRNALRKFWSRPSLAKLSR